MTVCIWRAFCTIRGAEAGGTAATDGQIVQSGRDITRRDNEAVFGQCSQVNGIAPGGGMSGGGGQNQFLTQYRLEFQSGSATGASPSPKSNREARNSRI